MRLWNDYMYEEYGNLDCDFVFVNLWGGRVGMPLSYSNVDRIVARTQRRVGFRFTPHQLRHTFATLAYRDGVQFEVIGALLTHRSPSSTLIYTHPAAEDLRAVQSCPHPNACLSCESFLTDGSHRAVHQQQQAETRRLLEKARKQDNARLIEVLERDEQSSRESSRDSIRSRQTTPMPAARSSTCATSPPRMSARKAPDARPVRSPPAC